MEDAYMHKDDELIYYSPFISICCAGSSFEAQWIVQYAYASQETARDEWILLPLINGVLAS